MLAEPSGFFHTGHVWERTREPDKSARNDASVTGHSTPRSGRLWPLIPIWYTCVAGEP